MSSRCDNSARAGGRLRAGVPLMDRHRLVRRHARVRPRSAAPRGGRYPTWDVLRMATSEGTRPLDLANERIGSSSEAAPRTDEQVGSASLGSVLFARPLDGRKDAAAIRRKDARKLNGRIGKGWRLSRKRGRLIAKETSRLPASQPEEAESDEGTNPCFNLKYGSLRLLLRVVSTIPPKVFQERVPIPKRNLGHGQT